MVRGDCKGGEEAGERERGEKSWKRRRRGEEYVCLGDFIAKESKRCKRGDSKLKRWNMKIESKVKEGKMCLSRVVENIYKKKS